MRDANTRISDLKLEISLHITDCFGLLLLAIADMRVDRPEVSSDILVKLVDVHHGLLDLSIIGSMMGLLMVFDERTNITFRSSK